MLGGMTDQTTVTRDHGAAGRSGFRRAAGLPGSSMAGLRTG